MSIAQETSAARPKADALPVRRPTSNEDLRTLIKRAIAALRRIQNAESRRRARIDYHQQRIEDLKAQSLKVREEQLGIIRKIMPRAYAYIESNRFELTNRDQRKSIAFPDGTFRWVPVTFTDIPDEEAFLAEVRTLRLKKFIRVKYEPNRTALLEDKNKELRERLTTARLVDEVRPQLVVPGLTLRIERVRGEHEGEFKWDVVEPKQRS